MDNAHDVMTQIDGRGIFFIGRVHLSPGKVPPPPKKKAWNFFMY